MWCPECGLFHEPHDVDANQICIECYKLKEETPMTNILIIGSTGMLGQQMVKHFRQFPDKYNVFTTSRNFVNDDNNFVLNIDYYNLCDIECIISESEIMFDYVFNCAGVIKQKIEKTHDNEVNTWVVNGIFPNALANTCQRFGIKLIHITTDCTKSGKELYPVDPESAYDYPKLNCYDENSPNDATDVYGRSKSLGEPIHNSMVIRTSYIGEETGAYELIGWYKSQAGKTIQGYTNHFWNGLTTKQMAVCYQDIIEKKLWQTGLYHVYSPEIWSKYTLLKCLEAKYKLGVKIVPHNCEQTVDRSLGTVKDLCERLHIPPLVKQIEEL